jgi:hypothetical protein
MRPISTALFFAFVVCVGAVSLGTACAAPGPRASACESACVNPEDESCQRCLDREERAERRRRESPPPSFPSGGGGGSPGGY